MAKKITTPTRVESIRRKDKRANIPTEKLRDFVAEDEKAPKTVLYPVLISRRADPGCGDFDTAGSPSANPSDQCKL